jgi:hypothetical protein
MLLQIAHFGGQRFQGGHRLEHFSLMPVSELILIYTIVMMRTPKKGGRPTSFAAESTACRSSLAFGKLPVLPQTHPGSFSEQ